jgi:hypothetical protein
VTPFIHSSHKNNLSIQSKQIAPIKGSIAEIYKKYGLHDRTGNTVAYIKRFIEAREEFEKETSASKYLQGGSAWFFKINKRY